MKLFLTIIAVVAFVSLGYSQSPYINRGDQAYHTYDRLEILRKLDSTLVNGINNLDRAHLVKLLKDKLDLNSLSAKDKFDIQHILADNYEFLNEDSRDTVVNKYATSDFKAFDESETTATYDIFDKRKYNQSPTLKYFYNNKANFLTLETPSFSMYINPIVQVGYTRQVNNDNIVFQNTRGVEVRAYIDKKVYIYTQLLENQRNYVDFVTDRALRYQTLPGQGFWKNYSSSVIDNLNGYDFFNARAYVGFDPVKSINVEFGHGNHFIGNGYRSLLLSDYSQNYFYLKLNTRIWKFQYQNIFAELAPISTLLNPNDRLLPKKYMATHYLAFKPNSKFEVGLFETVMFARPDHFEFQYLNPVILYRAVEHFLDSPDNVLLGLNIKYNPIAGISLYGQVILDEFKLSEVRKQSGWWANKFGGQIGIKYINALGIDHLDLQLEHNEVRPYTYAHRDSLPGFPRYSVANYSTVNQPLAHLLGANFRETVLLFKYKPSDKIYLSGRALYTVYGDDPSGRNWGGNILLPLQTIEQDYGNVIGQGIRTTVKAVHLEASYEVYHNYFIDLQAQLRETTTSAALNHSFYSIGIRANINNIHYDY